MIARVAVTGITTERSMVCGVVATRPESSITGTEPSSDRHAQIEREWEAKFKALQREFDTYRGNAETSVKIALSQHSNANVSIGEHGEVRGRPHANGMPSHG